MNATDIIKGLSPLIGTVLGGPVGGVLVPAATNWIADKLGLETKTVEAVADAIQGLDPQKRVELEQDFAKWNAEFSLRQDQVYLQDTQDARSRDVELAKAGRKNTRADFIVAVTFIGILSSVSLAVLKSDLNDFAKTLINVVIGVLLADWKQITSFEFGTTKSSQTKDSTINNLTKGS